MAYRKVLPAAALLAAVLAAGAGLAAPKGPEALNFYPGATPATADGGDQGTWLVLDDGDPTYYFLLPDEYDDHYFNNRFTVAGECSLLQAAFLFMLTPGDTVSTVPDVRVLVWPGGAQSIPPVPPDQALDSLTVPDELVKLYTDSTQDTTYVNLEEMNLGFGPANPTFHLGWEPVLTDTSDGPLGILTDDGIPTSTTSSEWWGDQGRWGTMFQDWGVGVNFMIRVEVEYVETGVRAWLDPDRPDGFVLAGPYPNPFNPETTFIIRLAQPRDVRLEAYDLNGRLVERIAAGAFPAGSSHVTWQAPDLPSGQYLVRLSTGARVLSTRAVLLK
ncbi:MAG: T9SS C-terminal target domain-containing protein [Candidatus Zixiibacteriota bacterium]|nr:MAG: T9SS C-terminal target domain-containing protein [candidate division Zixibacteria bacterium]